MKSTTGPGFCLRNFYISRNQQQIWLIRVNALMDSAQLNSVDEIGVDEDSVILGSSNLGVEFAALCVERNTLT
jgi:hypothetical protein